MCNYSGTSLGRKIKFNQCCYALIFEGILLMKILIKMCLSYRHAKAAAVCNSPSFISVLHYSSLQRSRLLLRSSYCKLFLCCWWLRHYVSETRFTRKVKVQWKEAVGEYTLVQAPLSVIQNWATYTFCFDTFSIEHFTPVRGESLMEKDMCRL